jgi:hypothetical protein
VEGIDLLYEEDINECYRRIQKKNKKDDPFNFFAMDDPVNGKKIITANKDGIRIIVKKIVQDPDA